MTGVTKPWNTAAWWALLLAMAALSVNFVLFANPPWQRVLPWVGLALAIQSLVELGIAVWRTIARSQVYRGKWLSAVLAVLTLVVSAANVFVFFHARALPASSAAPQVGQQAPDFTLSDATGQLVSLDRLFNPPLFNSLPGDASLPATKAVLLIFYRGYW